MKRKFKFFIVTSLLGGMFLFQGCGLKEEVTSVEGKQKVLDIVVADDGIQGNGMRHIVEKFEKENPNIKVNMLEMPYGDLKIKVTMMIQGGNPPALARVTDAMVYDGALLELDEESTENVIKPLQGYTRDSKGKIIAMPITSTANGLIVNKLAFEKAGIDVPKEVKTWEEMENILKRVAERSGTKYPLVWDVSPSRWSTILYQYGGSFFSEDLSKGNFNSKEAINALTKFKELHDSQVLPEAVWVGGEDSSAIFKSGMAVGILSGSWKITEFDRDIKNFQWEVVRMPKGTVRSSVAGGNLMVGFKGSKMEKEAKEFLKFMKREDIYKVYLKETGFMSSFNGVKVEDIGYEVRPDAYGIFVEELEVSPEVAGREWGERTVIMGKVHPELKDEIVEMIKGDKNPTDVAENINKLINSAIEENE